MDQIENTDAVILMQFRDAVAHLVDLPLGEATAAMGEIGRPYLDRLKANGHEWTDAIGLMRSVWIDLEKGKL